MKILKEWITLLLIFVITYGFMYTFLKNYTILTLSLLVLFYILRHIIINKSIKNPLALSYYEVIFFVAIAILFIATTGGINSPFFFTLYIISFGITLFLHPSIIILFIGVIILLFNPYPSFYSMEDLVKIIPLLSLSPLAYYFGKQYQERKIKEKKLTSIIEKDKQASVEIQHETTKLLADIDTLNITNLHEIENIIIEAKTIKSK